MLRLNCRNIKCKIPYDIDNFKEPPVVSAVIQGVLVTNL